MIQWLVGQAGIAGLAAFALYTLNTSYQSSLRREQDYAEANRSDKVQLVSVLHENTVALTKLGSMLEQVLYGQDRKTTQ